ncbi:MAG: MFS transporter [Pseudomonadota bacterium]
MGVQEQSDLAQGGASQTPRAALIQIAGNRNFLALLTANTILASAFPIQLILAGLAGLMLAPSAGLATLPASLQTLAGLLAAAPVSLLMGRLGRAAGFALGAVLTIAGGLIAVQALYAQSFGLLCLGHFSMGAGWATFQYFRFAAGEAVGVSLRPVAISLMLSSGLVAALVGPEVFILARDALDPIPFAGAYVALAVLAVIGLIPLAAVRLPKPSRAKPGGARIWPVAREALSRPAVAQAVAIAAVAQGVMVFLMVPTPMAMVGCGFGDETASDVIRWHIVAMFAPSFFTGFLIQRFGAKRIAVTGLAVIASAAMFAASGIAALNFYGALIVLGIGWNFSFIGATSLLAADVSEEEKAAVQGANDTIIALVSTLAAFAAGAVVSGPGWAVLALMSVGVVALCLIALARLSGRAARA